MSRELAHLIARSICDSLMHADAFNSPPGYVQQMPSGVIWTLSTPLRRRLATSAVPCLPR